MNYDAHYERLIERARHRTLVGYRERHHVLPKCMSGGNERENIVELTGEEHYVAHQLLVKMYPAVRGLAIAAVRMARQCTGNKAYGWLKRRRAKLISLAMMGHRRNVGFKHTAESRARMSAAHKGKRGSFSGNRHSPATLAKIGASSRGRKNRLGAVTPPEVRAKISASLRGNQNTLGKMHSSETKKNMSVSRKRYLDRMAALTPSSPAGVGC